MTYGITRLVLGCQQFIEITKDEYEAAKRGQTNHWTILGIEEKFSLLVENYAEFELELQQLTTRYLLFLGRDWSSFRDDIYVVNRRVVNLLSAGRLYTDQVKHDVSVLFGHESEQSEQLKRALAEQYDTHLGYRVVEALRNWVQHQNLPVHELKYNGTRDDRDGITLLKHICIPSMCTAIIVEQGGFKSTVLAELAGKEDHDLRPFVRQYMASVGQVHAGLRKMMAETGASWDLLLESIRTKFRQLGGENLVGLGLVVKDSHGLVESWHVVADAVDRRKALEVRTPFLTHLPHSYISTEAARDK